MESARYLAVPMTVPASVCTRVAADRKMMAVDLALGSTVEAGTPKALFQTQVVRSEAPNRYAVSGDGQRFLVNSPRGGG